MKCAIIVIYWCVAPIPVQSECWEFQALGPVNEEDWLDEVKKRVMEKQDKV